MTRLLSVASVIVLVGDLGVLALVFGMRGKFLDGVLLTGEEGEVSVPLPITTLEESEIGELGTGEDKLLDGVVLDFLTLLLLVFSSSSLEIWLPEESFLS